MTLEAFNEIANKINIKCVRVERKKYIGVDVDVTYNLHLIDKDIGPIQFPDWYGAQRNMEIEDLNIEIEEE